MSPLSLLLNLLWMIFGGIWMAIGWLIAAVIMAITIVGIPWARAAFNIASYTLLPFGRRAVSRAEYLGTNDIGTGPLGFLGNLIWLVLAGWWLALGHLIMFASAHSRAHKCTRAKYHLPNLAPSDGGLYDPGRAT